MQPNKLLHPRTGEHRRYLSCTKPTREEKQIIKTEDIVIRPVCRGIGREVVREDISRAIGILNEGNILLTWTLGTPLRTVPVVGLDPNATSRL